MTDEAPVPRSDSLSEPSWIVGVDIGGTNARVGLVPFTGGPAECLRHMPTLREEGADAVLARLVALIEDCMASQATDGVPGAIVGMGIGCPGPLDRASGVVIDTPNLRWKDVAVRDRIAEAVGLDAVLENDANCATYGEWWQGAGRGSRVLLGLTLGTGVGGGVVLDGEILHGATDGAGELGHMSVDYEGRPCPCGSVGCLEAYASGLAVAQRAEEGLAEGATSSLRSKLGEQEGLTAEAVTDAAVAGDAFCQAILAETGRILGYGAASLINVFNPDRIVVAGGVARAGEYLLGPLKQAIAGRAFSSAVQACAVVPALLPGTAGLIGAAGAFKKARYGDL